VPGKGKELLYAVHANGMNEMIYSAENVEGWATGIVQHSGTDCMTNTENDQVPNIPTHLHDDYWETTLPLHH
jgi:hypothetical protein